MSYMTTGVLPQFAQDFIAPGVKASGSSTVDKFLGWAKDMGKGVISAATNIGKSSGVKSGEMTFMAPAPSPKVAGISPMLLLGGAALVAFLVLKKK